jgi:hypothetical protein
MNKKNINLSFFTIAVVGLFCSLALNIFSQKKEIQKTEQSQPKCLGKLVLPSSISVNNEAFEDFIKVASLPAKERRILFSKQSNEQKASFIKVNLALQFIKRPSMTSDQKEFVLDAVSKVSADIYDKSDSEKVKRSEQNGLEMQNKALGLFAHKDLGDFIEPLMPNKEEEVAILQNYVALLKNGMIARKRIINDMPVNDRVNIWKVQLAYHLATGKFTKKQNEFILEMLTSLSPKTFASPANLTKEEQDKANGTLESSIFDVFTKEEGFAIFMAVGIQTYAADGSEFEIEGSICDCNFYCSDENLVCGEPKGCQSSSSGCGPYGSVGCHYKCARR